MPLASGKAQVVIVDGIVATRDGLAQLLFLNRMVEVVGLAASGAEAITQVSQLQPDIVLLDVTLPDMPCWNVIDTIIHQAPRARIIVMSDEGTAYYLTPPIPEAIYALLIKPITAETLAKAIRHARKV